MNTDKISVLVLLDLSVPFDAVDHSIYQLAYNVGLSKVVLSWLRSYLQDRSFYVSMANLNAIYLWCPSGVNSWTFDLNLYILPLGQIIKNHSINYHSYADDTQICFSLSPKILPLLESLHECLSQINNWVSQNLLQLNMNKTEVIVLGNNEQRIKTTTLQDTMELKAKETVKNLGVIVDSDLSFSSHAKK